jgi:hypothetical protein
LGARHLLGAVFLTQPTACPKIEHMSAHKVVSYQLPATHCQINAADN